LPAARTPNREKAVKAVVRRGNIFIIG